MIMLMGVSLRSSLAGLWRADLAPVRQTPAESSSEKAGLQRVQGLSQVIILTYKICASYI